MSLSAGSRLGPYEIVSPLGAGGMGEVYKARDTRLGRDLAIKILPGESATDPERLARFEQEARSASALNHPNIVAVYDVGRDGPTSYLAMELVEGRTVRELLPSGPLPIKRALSIASQVAAGLARAHAAGILHRDLKPENVMVTADGLVKILDFGLAKLVAPTSGNVSEALTSAGSETASGVVVGTAGYMSPEQATGRTLDFRSDQFALGSTLYEILTGRRAFSRANVVDTLSAILHDEPEPLQASRPDAPLLLCWIVERCLAKEPAERYASTQDLARDLARVRDHLVEARSTEVPSVPPSKRRFAMSAAAVSGVALLLILAGLLGIRLLRAELPKYRQITFRQGTIRMARFSPDGNTIHYGAAWAALPIETFSVRPGTPESRPLGIPRATVAAISRSGEMALLLRYRYLGLFPGSGTLARVPLEGGAAPREIVDDVLWADWSPEGNSLAIVRSRDGRSRIEYPIGKVLHETTGWISHARVSPDGHRIAFLKHPILEEDRGSVAVVDQSGKNRILGRIWSSAWGLAWRPDGKEIWFTAARQGFSRELYGVSLSGRERLIARLMGTLTLHDISRDGSVLIARDDTRLGIVALPPAGNAERELSWLDAGLATDISSDGRQIAFFEAGEGGGDSYSVYIRATDGSPAVRLGSGWAPVFSPDGKWVIVMAFAGDSTRLAILPTGPGEARPLVGEQLRPCCAEFLPDGKHFVFSGREAGHRNRLYVQPTSGGVPRPITGENLWTTGPVSPDGRFVPAVDSAGRLFLYPTFGGRPSPIAGAEPGEQVSQWSADGKRLYLWQAGELPATVFRIDPFSGQRERWKEIAPSDLTGVAEVLDLVMNRTATSYAYTYARILSTLYVADGLK